MAEAWGDAPPVMTCPKACTDSEKSFVLRRLHSSPVRKGHESRKQDRGLTRSPSVSPLPLDKHSPILSQCDSHASPVYKSAYFTSDPPSAPITLMARKTLRIVDTIHATTSTTNIEKTASYYPGIRSLVEEIADEATNQNRDTLPREVTSGSCSLNVACSSPESHFSTVKRRRFRRHSVAVTRNVAVQAISLKLEGREGNHVKSADNQLEWVGGVRALRDSHVRHVLRQLKHIDRLNRALDRVHHSETD